MTQAPPLEKLTYEEFLTHKDSHFSLIQGSEPAADLTLVEVSTSPPPAEGMRQPFSLIFSGTPGVVLPQQIYTLTHAEMGTLEIFLVPIGATPAATQYQAIFS